MKWTKTAMENKFTLINRPNGTKIVQIIRKGEKTPSLYVDLDFLIDDYIELQDNINEEFNEELK